MVPAEPHLISIGGSMRSGTTLLQRMFCSCGRTGPMMAECQYLWWQLRLHARGVQEYERHLGEYFGNSRSFDRHSRLIVESFLAIVRSARRCDGARILKCPQLTPFFAQLNTWVNESGFVVIVRDPRDVVASMIEIGHRQREKGLQTELTVVGRNIKELCAYFKSFYVNAINSRTQFGGKLVLTRYEDLVQSPKNVFSSIAQQLGLKPSGHDLLKACETAGSLGGVGTERNEEDGTFWSHLYEKPVSSERIGAHKKTLTRMEVREIKENCQDVNEWSAIGRSVPRRDISLLIFST